MLQPTIFLAILMAVCQVQAKAVFAHFMMTNSPSFTLQDWTHHIQLAQTAHIDAFALNMQFNDPANDHSLPLAFQAAESLGFHLFFSFDYAANGSWLSVSVMDYITAYSSSSAYYMRGDQPLVSTFEGPDRAADWEQLREVTGCFFLPDWSSKGAKVALDLGRMPDGQDITDGLFNWAAWPTAPNNMSTLIDASYQYFLDGKPYMMPVSPWFYTNLPGFEKNWLWRGDDLWFTRWQQVFTLKPDYVEIISWNDYGESHYIGPLPQHSDEFAAFNIGRGPFNYAAKMPHDGWREILPFAIDFYKIGTASITQEKLVSWYRLNPAGACFPAGTTGNTVSQLQMELNPATVVQDKVFYTALLGSSCDVTVSIGGVSQAGTWSSTPPGGVGLYYGSVPFNNHNGQVVVTLSRGGATVAQILGNTITSDCSQTSGFENWNAWVASANGPSIAAVNPSLNLSQIGCVQGTGDGDYITLCQFACQHNYCPEGACTCTKLGEPISPPAPKNIQGYPAPGKDCSYLGLCSYSCNYGVCPTNVCSTDPSLNGTCSSVVDPNAGLVCNAGSGSGKLNTLCQWSCRYGFCPSPCTCSKYGTQITPPAVQTTLQDIVGYAVSYNDYSSVRSMCDYACQRGFCPDGVCTYNVPWGEYTNAPPQSQCLADKTAWPCELCPDNNDCLAIDHTAAQIWNCSKAGQLLSSFQSERAIINQNYGGDWLEDLGKYTNYSTGSALFDCQVAIAGGLCDSEIAGCPANQTLAANVLLNSIISMKQFYSNWYNALANAETGVATLATNFNNTFNPTDPDSIWDTIWETLLSTVLDAVGGKAFDLAKSGLESQFGNSTAEKLGQAWDEVYGFISGQVEDAATPGAKGGTVTFGDLTAMIDNITTTYKTSITDNFNSLFKGTDDSVSNLTIAVGQGVWIRMSITNTTAPELEEMWRSMIMSSLIPYVWARNTDFYPVVVYTNISDDTSNPTDLDDSDAEFARYSIGGKTFWLVGLKSSCDDLVGKGFPDCLGKRFQALPGLNTLTGPGGTFGDLSVPDILTSVYGGWKLGGYSNGYNISTAPDGIYRTDGSGTTSVYPYASGPQTPGLWSYNICDASTLQNTFEYLYTYEKTPLCKYFPCCTCDELQPLCSGPDLDGPLTTPSPVVSGYSMNGTSTHSTSMRSISTHSTSSGSISTNGISTTKGHARTASLEGY